MARKWINEETPIGVVIQKKGLRAEKLMNKMICNGEKDCCLGATTTIKTALILKSRQHLLVDIITKLNNLPNIPCIR